MADVVLNFVVERVLEAIVENLKLLKADGKDELQAQLKDLNAFLKDAKKYRKSDSEKWKNFVDKVQVLVYEAECLMDRLLVLVKEHQDKNMFMKAIDTMNFLPNTKVAKEIKDITGRAAKILANTAFQATPKLPDLPRIHAPQPQDTCWEETEIVGFEEEANTVIQRLLDDEGGTNLEVIPVVGLPGLGKTTLAMKISKDRRIKYEFFYNIWVYAGPEYKQKEVLLSILDKLEIEIAEKHQNMDADDLREKISETLSSSGGKSLIVLDDVWNTNVIDDVIGVFPNNNKGHRIMMTTRKSSIGRYATTRKPHMLKFLKDEESFQLLEKRVFIGRSGKSCPQELVEHGKSIAEQCGGVPLAVVVIAGALRGQTSKDYWEFVNANVGNHLIDKDKPDSCLRYVEISYDELPEDMKPCFLYCGTFPRGFEIPAWKLVRLWISEGLMNSKLEGRPEDIADIYLNELVNRNLVMVTKKRADGRVKTCRIHDMLHQFCKMEATSGGLFQELYKKSDQGSLAVPTLGTSPRVSMQVSLLKDFFSKEQSAENIRSFLCFSNTRKGSEKLDNITLLHKAFPFIKVFDVEPLEFRFTRNCTKLHHLRYIAISGDYESLPEYFGSFWNLQTVILDTKKPSIKIKADIWKMLQLRHLHTNVPATLPSPATKPSCLQTLCKVTPGSCKEDVLARACNLRKVTVEGEMADFFEAKKGGFNNFEKLKCLEQLKLLNIGNSLSKLPPEFPRFLCTLKKLTLSDTQFDWSDANRLGELECLEFLKLKENAFTGTTWDSEGFSQLKLLQIQRANFKTWNTSQLSFRGLKCLVLKLCDKLEVVPFELAGVSSLEEITLENSKYAITSAKAIRAEKEKKNKGKAAESNSGTVNQSFKFKLTIFPPETPDRSATQ